MQETAFWRTIPVLLLAHLVQTTWLARVVVLDTRIDLPLLVAVSVALLGGVQRGAWCGFGAGILTGLQTASHLGSFLVSRTVAASLIGLSPRALSPDNPLAPPVCAVAATLLADAIFMVMSPTDYPFLWWVRHAPIACAMHALLIWPVFFLIQRLVKPPVKPMFV
jgi:hypothetical protein